VAGSLFDKLSGNGRLALAADYARCARITRDSSTNFYYAFMLAPPEQRRAMYAVYAFCRLVDNIADESVVREPRWLLARWRRELERVFDGVPTLPVSRALADSARRFNLSRHHFEQVIAGVEMDATRKRYQNFEELRLYCLRVASAVGQISIGIFGYHNPQTESYAEHLGIAFQLTNIVRDVREDAARGRIYLPLDELARFEVNEEEILRGVPSAGFARLMEFEVERARSYYERAAKDLAAEDRQAMLSAEAMRLIYSNLLEQIARSGYRVLDQNFGLSAAHKVFLVAKAWAKSRLRSQRI
jgi:15-cis-phytoene synthase